MFFVPPSPNPAFSGVRRGRSVLTMAMSLEIYVTTTKAIALIPRHWNSNLGLTSASNGSHVDSYLERSSSVWTNLGGKSCFHQVCHREFNGYAPVNVWPFMAGEPLSGLKS